MRNCSKFDLWASTLASSFFRGNAAKKVAPRRKPPPVHNLTLYDFEASPWCRLVREQATILDLNLNIRPCPRESIYLQGAYTNRSRFRPAAHLALKQLKEGSSSLTFPILVDKTLPNQDIVLKESYYIVQHLWENYGRDVIPSRGRNNRRPDQVVNSSKLPFPIRFLSLAGPSYLRCRPHHGLMRVPSVYIPADEETTQHYGFKFTLYQVEGCPDSRLVREVLCSLELPYFSISCADGSYSIIPAEVTNIPTLLVDAGKDSKALVGYLDIIPFLWQTFHDKSDVEPSWFDRISKIENVGQEESFGMAAYTAFLRGRRAFVPPIVEE